MKNKHFDKQWIPAKYIQRFHSWKSALDMWALGLFPNIKEVAESMAMFYAVEEKLMKWDSNIDRKAENINVVVIGDGTKPRTAAVFAFNMRWKCWSIDPDMKTTDYPTIQRLTVIKDRVENVDPIDFGDEILIIIMPHSHAPINECWNRFKSTRKWLIKLECCTHDRLNLPYFAYNDAFAITKANNIFIWCNYMQLDFTNKANGESLAKGNSVAQQSNNAAEEVLKIAENLYDDFRCAGWLNKENFQSFDAITNYLRDCTRLKARTTDKEQPKYNLIQWFDDYDEAPEIWDLTSDNLILTFNGFELILQSNGTFILNSTEG